MRMNNLETATLNPGKKQKGGGGGVYGPLKRDVCRHSEHILLEGNHLSCQQVFLTLEIPCSGCSIPLIVLQAQDTPTEQPGPSFSLAPRSPKFS